MKKTQYPLLLKVIDILENDNGIHVSLRAALQWEPHFKELEARLKHAGLNEDEITDLVCGEEEIQKRLMRKHPQLRLVYKFLSAMFEAD